jgi:NAD-reducing hydrogenase large subunit
MARTILIDPVTRIEGHAKITIELDEAGNVNDAHFHVTQVRGFEKFCEGRPFQEMPSLMARICGICPVSHLLASASACDALMAVQIPETAASLRRVMNLAQVIQSHALSFFYLSSPDLLLGMDADPVKRNLVGVLQAAPELAHDGIALRRFGQQIIESLGGKRIHPGWIVPGGVSEPLDSGKRDEILRAIPEAREKAERVLVRFKALMDNFRAETESFANFPSLFMGMVDHDGLLVFSNGKLRVVDAQGNIIADQLEPAQYMSFIGEAVEPWSYLKSAYYKPLGYPDGMYRVGPLARLNVANGCGTERAHREWVEFRQRQAGAVLSSFDYHYARLIEILYGIERIEQRLSDPQILGKHVRAHAQPNNFEGVGCAEAPRGTLFHHYKIDEHGLMTWVNLIIATGQNNLAMNRGVLQAAREYVHGERIEQGALNRVEAVIRTFDPCLSCSTHAVGQMPLDIQLVRSDGVVVDRLKRG